MESELGLEPLPGVYLLESIPKPVARIWHPQNREWKRLIGNKRWAWQPPEQDIEEDTTRGRRNRRRNATPQASATEVSAIASVIQFDTIREAYRLDASLANNFLDKIDDIGFHALIETPHGGLFIGKVETPMILVGRNAFAGGVFDEYLKKAAQLRLYRDHPDVMELRIVNTILRKEILPAGTRPNSRKPREFTQSLLACRTLIIQATPN